MSATGSPGSATASDDDCDDELSTIEEEGEESPVNNNAVQNFSIYGRALTREEEAIAPRISRLRPFQKAPCLARCGRTPYTSKQRPPPYGTLSFILGGRSLGVMHVYESQFKERLVHLFETLRTTKVPSSGAGGGDVVAVTPDVAGLMTSTDMAGVGTPGLRRQATLRGAKEGRSSDRKMAAPVPVPISEEAEKLFCSDFEGILDEAEALMVLEDLNWPALFHLRYRTMQRLIAKQDLEHIRALVEAYLTPQHSSEGQNANLRKLASKLKQYLVSHSMDPDGSLIGQRPSQALEVMCITALSSAPPAAGRILSWDADGHPVALDQKTLAHGMVVLANLSNTPGAAPNIVFVRFSRMDPTRPSHVQLWCSPHQRDHGVSLDCQRGVFFLRESERACLGVDLQTLATITYNPVAPLERATAKIVSDRFDGFLIAQQCDLFLLHLTKEDLVSASLDLSSYGLSPERGQEMCTELLSLLDKEKKKLVSVRSSFNATEIEETSVMIRVNVDAFLKEYNVAKVESPLRRIHVNVARNLPVRCAAAFQQCLDAQMSKLEGVIDFVIVNWKQLCDPKLRTSLGPGSQIHTRERSWSRVSSLGNFLAGRREALHAANNATSADGTTASGGSGGGSGGASGSSPGVAASASRMSQDASATTTANNATGQATPPEQPRAMKKGLTLRSLFSSSKGKGFE